MKKAIHSYTEKSDHTKKVMLHTLTQKKATAKKKYKTH